MAETYELSRRSFLGHTLALGAAGVFAPRIASAQVAAPTAANNRIQLGVIGVGAQAQWHLDVLLKQPDVAITAICDVWPERLENAIAKCGGTPKGYRDYRELLAAPDVDAVLIAAMPHWHALMAIDACEAKKDFYLEKPMTLSVGESLAVLRAVRKHKRITQIGTQVHAEPNYRHLVDVVRSGVLGKISSVRTFHVLNQGPEGIGDPPVEDLPKGLDWDMWCGPAPKRPYHQLLAKDAYYHGSFMDYSGGWTPGMAPHIVDLPIWALELGIPTCTSASGGRYSIRDCGDAYDVHEVMWQYPGMTMTWWTSLINSYGFDNQGNAGMRRRRGIYFHGVNGTLLADYNVCKIIPEGDRMTAEPEVEKVIPDSPGHHREWLDCLRTRQQPSCHVGYHYRIDVALNLSLLALKLGRAIRFDPATEKVIGDAEAAKLCMPQYRDPWKIPAEYLSNA